MFYVNVIASGSTGNCTVLRDEHSAIMLDAGIPFKKIQKSLRYKLPEYVLITHEHEDHAHKSTIEELLLRGAEVFMTAGTMNALGLEESYNLHIITDVAQVPGYTFRAVKVQHDAAEPVAFEIESKDECILYLTDAGEIPNISGFTKIIIETNYFESQLKASGIDEGQRSRIAANHLAVEKVAAYFESLKERNLLSGLQEVHLIHISARHGEGTAMKALIRSAVGEITVFS